MELKRIMATAAFVATIPAVTLAAPALVGDPHIVWQSVGTLSPALGTEKQLGVAGLFAGTSHGYVIAGGGANFPNGGPLEGGPKKMYPDVYVLKVSDKGLQETDHQTLPFPVAYGAAATTEEGVLYFGGSSDPEGDKAVTRLTASDTGKLSHEVLPPLPFAFQNGFAVAAEDGTGRIYLGLGNQDGKASNRVWAYHPKTGELAELPAFPGAPRTQSVAALLGGRLCVFSGGSDVAYTDGYAYDPQKNAWEELAPVRVDGVDISLLGAGAARLSADELIVVGGFDKTVWDWASRNLGTLKGEERDAFRKAYFSMVPDDYHWNRQILVYNVRENAWRSIGDVPFQPPCGEGLVKVGHTILSINGEVKPGVRSNRIYEGLILAK